MMLKILEIVAVERLMRNEDEFTIQLSSTLMEKAVDAANKIMGSPAIKQNEQMNEFKYNIHNKVFTIRNRAYRDNTNDPDVEEVLYKLAQSKLL